MAVEKSGIKMVGRADVDLGDPAEEGGLTIIAKVPVEPEVELGEYKGIEWKLVSGDFVDFTPVFLKK